ncbi:MAG: hypothetical protein QRY71_05145, partial [Candidatus Rhabdochlamydia sp.]
MRILDMYCSHSSPLNPSLDVNDIESLRIFLAEELHQLTHLQDIPHDILIRGDITLNYSNRDAFALLQSKNVKIEGSFTCYDLSLIQSLESLGVEKNLPRGGYKVLTILPKGLQVKGSLNLPHCKGLTHLPEDLTIEQDLNLSKCTTLTALPKGLKV